MRRKFIERVTNENLLNFFPLVLSASRFYFGIHIFFYSTFAPFFNSTQIVVYKVLVCIWQFFFADCVCCCQFNRYSGNCDWIDIHFFVIALRTRADKKKTEKHFCQWAQKTMPKTVKAVSLWKNRTTKNIFQFTENFILNLRRIIDTEQKDRQSYLFICDKQFSFFFVFFVCSFSFLTFGMCNTSHSNNLWLWHTDTETCMKW